MKSESNSSSKLRKNKYSRLPRWSNKLQVKIGRGRYCGQAHILRKKTFRNAQSRYLPCFRDKNLRSVIRSYQRDSELESQSRLTNWFYFWAGCMTAGFSVSYYIMNVAGGRHPVWDDWDD